MRSKPIPVSTCLEGSSLPLGRALPVVLDVKSFRQFKKTLAIAIYSTHMSRRFLQVAVFFSTVKVDLTAGTAWTGICHNPEIILASEEEHVKKDPFRAAVSSNWLLRHLSQHRPRHPGNKWRRAGLSGSPQTSVSSSHAQAIASRLL